MGRTFLDVPHITLALVRSLMFVPANRIDFMRGAIRHGADGIILDLQDSVPEPEEPEARENIRTVDQILDHLAGLPGRPYVCARTNPFWRGEDIVTQDIAAAVDARLDGVLIPEIRAVDQLESADRILAAERARAGVDRPIELIVLIETPEAVDLVDSIASTPTQAPLGGLVYGREDLTDHLGLPVRYEVGWQEPGSLLARLRVVWAAKRAHIAVLDSIPAKIGDEKVLEWESSLARSLGFTGRACVHPSQVEGIDRAFSVTAEDLAFAERAVASYDQALEAGRALTVVDSIMVDRPIANLHRAVLERTRCYSTFEEWKAAWRSAAEAKASAG